MTVFVALLRAINVGGTGKLAMKELSALCEELGLQDVKTYIQSGNVVFKSTLSESTLKTRLALSLARKVGKPVGVLLRTRSELASVLKRNPFSSRAPKLVLVMFLDDPLPKKSLAELVIPGGEEVKLSGREVFIHYPDGMGRSKLKLPFAKIGTGRNINTVLKLSQMAAELDGE